MALDGSKGLVPFALPHEAARQTAQRLDPDALLAVKPGVEVAIQVNAAVSQQEPKQVFDSLTSRLAAYGVKVVERSRLVLEASTGQGQTEEVTYQGFGGRGAGAQSTQVAQQISQLAFKEDGQGDRPAAAAADLNFTLAVGFRTPGA